MNIIRPIARGSLLFFLFMLGCALLASGQKSEKSPSSIGEIEASIKREPNNPKLLVALGLAYWDHNDYSHALEAFQRAVKVGPSSAEAHNWLGVAIMEKADLTGAIAEFKKAVDILSGLWEKVRERPDEFLDRVTIDTEGVDAAARDFVAGMTDRYALLQHRRLFDATPELR